MKKIGILAILMFVTACAGTDFKRLQVNQFSHGVDTTSSILAKMGTPYKTNTITKNGETFKLLAYAYSSSGGQGTQSNVTPGRGQNFYFHKGKLVGDEFVSSWAVDSTDFDGRSVKSIKEGSTRIGEVIQMLGDPVGGYVFPLVKNAQDQAIVYAYNHVTGSAFNLGFYQKQLVVSYNTQSGIVTNVEFVEAGTK